MQHRREAKLEALTRKLNVLRKREDVTWAREQTLKYIHQRPGATQTPTDVEAFFTKLGKLQLQYGFELTSTEALQMLNHRPTQAVEFQVLVEHFYDRVTSTEAQEAILELCQKLPAAPVIDSGDTDESTIAGEDIIDVDEEEQEEMALDEDQILAAQEENEFNVNAKNQLDKDVDVPMEDD